MTLPPVLYFGNDWFADNRTSSHHVARQLARHADVLYVEAPGLRRPRATSRDVRRIANKLTRATVRFEASERLIVRTLPQVPLHGSALARYVNRLVGTAFTNLALRREGMRRPIVWCTVPHVANLVSRVTRSLLVYHCIDDYSALPDVDVDAVRTLDGRLSRDEDLVVAASRPVFEAKQRLNRSTLLMPHGVDVEHFATARNGTVRPPEDVARLPRPVVGFIGLLERWIDLDLVGWLAGQLPNVSFVLIGRVAGPAAEIPRLPNVHVLGPRPYEALPAYGSCFDAAIIPYRLTDQVLAANPLKLREYLAMGLPVVSVSTPEVDQFADVVAVAATRSDFLAAVVAALNEAPDPAVVARRVDAVRHAGWAARVDGLLGHVASMLSEPERRRVA
jgi:glycosyltransferase involved in cell wall biosynthesis